MNTKLIKKVSIIIPAKDEEESIGPLLRDLNKNIASLKRKYSFEILVVADHCRDKTTKIAKQYEAVVIENLLSPGKGNALISGFNKAAGDYLIMMDADYSHRPEELPGFLDALDKGAGLVIGSRIYGGSEEYTRIRALGNILLTLSFGLLHGRYLSDALNGYKAFRREIFTDFPYTSSDFEIEIEILSNAIRKKLPVVEIPSHERKRVGGMAKSKVIKHGMKFFLRIVKEYYRNRKLPINQFKPCLICQKSDKKIFSEKNGYLITKCNQCGLTAVENLPDNKFLEKYYTEDYFVGGEKKFGYFDYELEEDSCRENFIKRINQIEKFKRGGKILDIGCAYGIFLGNCGSHWQKYGLEISKIATDGALKKYHNLHIFNGTLEEYNQVNNFDIVTMWDVLDHLNNPDRSLKYIYKLIKKDGLLILNIGDHRSLAAKLMGKKWYLLIPPTHLYYFNRQTITAMLEKNNFNIKEIHYEGKLVSLKLGFFRLKYIIGINALNKFWDFLGNSRIGQIKIYLNFFDVMTVYAQK